MIQVVLLGRIKNCPSLDIHDENGRILFKFFAFYNLLDSCTVCSINIKFHIGLVRIEETNIRLHLNSNLRKELTK